MSSSDSDREAASATQSAGAAWIYELYHEPTRRYHRLLSSNGVGVLGIRRMKCGPNSGYQRERSGY